MIRQSNELVFYTTKYILKKGAKSYLMNYFGQRFPPHDIRPYYRCEMVLHVRALKPYQFSKTSVFEASPLNPLIIIVPERFECGECGQCYANPRHYISCTASLNLDNLELSAS